MVTDMNRLISCFLRTSTVVVQIGYPTVSVAVLLLPILHAPQSPFCSRPNIRQSTLRWVGLSLIKGTPKGSHYFCSKIRFWHMPSCKVLQLTAIVSPCLPLFCGVGATRGSGRLRLGPRPGASGAPGAAESAASAALLGRGRGARADAKRKSGRSWSVSPSDSGSYPFWGLLWETACLLFSPVGFEGIYHYWMYLFVLLGGLSKFKFPLP